MRPSKGRMVCMIEFISLRGLVTFGEGWNVLLGVTALFPLWLPLAGVTIPASAGIMSGYWDLYSSLLGK